VSYYVCRCLVQICLSLLSLGVRRAATGYGAFRLGSRFPYEWLVGFFVWSEWRRLLCGCRGGPRMWLLLWALGLVGLRLEASQHHYALWIWRGCVRFAGCFFDLVVLSRLLCVGVAWIWWLTSSSVRGILIALRGRPLFGFWCGELERRVVVKYPAEFYRVRCAWCRLEREFPPVVWVRASIWWCAYMGVGLFFFFGFLAVPWQVVEAQIVCVWVRLMDCFFYSWISYWSLVGCCSCWRGLYSWPHQSSVLLIVQSQR